MKKVIDFIIKYKYIFLLIMLYLLFFLQMQNVYMYADDYNVINLLTRNKNFFETIYFAYYKSWSGRLIGQTLVTAGLGFLGLQFFRILNPLFLFLFCFYLAKIINIKKKYDIFKLTFVISLVVVGLNIELLNELLYWCDGTILYMWGYVPMVMIIYFVINDKKLGNWEFLLSLIFIFIISFTMESTATLITVFLFFINLKNIIQKKYDKKIIFLFIFSFILLFGSYFIPGNLNRLSQQDEIFKNANVIEKFIIKLPEYFKFLFNSPFFNILFIISMILAVFLLKNKNKIYKMVGLFLIIFNIVIFINTFIFKFIYFENIIIYIISFIYLLANIFACFIINYADKHDQIYFYLIIAAICSNLVSVILIEYSAKRFYYTLIIILIVFAIHYYLKCDIKTKIFILWLFCLVSFWQLGLILFFIYVIFNGILNKKLNILKYLLFFIFIILNIYSFCKTFYCYYENSKIFDYNIEIIKNIDKSKTNIIYLKKLKYPNYAFHMPENADYVVDWYYEYYKLQNQKVVWVE